MERGDDTGLLRAIARTIIQEYREGARCKRILLFAAGCAAAALLYWLWGFWCLAAPVAIGAAAAVMRLEETAQQK